MKLQTQVTRNLLQTPVMMISFYTQKQHTAQQTPHTLYAQTRIHIYTYM